MKTEVFAVAVVAVITAVAVGGPYKSFPEGFDRNYAAREFDKVAPAPKLNWSGKAADWVANAGAKGWETVRMVRAAKVGALVVWRSVAADAPGPGADDAPWSVSRDATGSRTAATNQLAPAQDPAHRIDGHVAVVTGLTADGLVISEMNFGPVTDAKSGKTVNFGKVTKTSLRYASINRPGYQFLGYIYPERK